MPTATYKLQVDWDNDLVLESPEEDNTADLIEADITRGFNDSLARVGAVGRATFILDNSAKSYSPPLVANARPMRIVAFDMTYDETETRLFLGYLEDIEPDAGPLGERRVCLSCVDATELLDQHEGPIPLQTYAFADEIIKLVVDEVYSPPSENYGPGLNCFVFSADRWAFNVANPEGGPAGAGGGAWGGQTYAQETRAMQKIEQACVGDWGRFYIAGNGYPTYVNRYAAPFAATSACINTTMVGMDYKMSCTDIINACEVTCHPRTLGNELEVVGRLKQRDPAKLEATGTPGDERTFVLRFRDPSNSAIRLGCASPANLVSGTDYAVTDEVGGTGTDESSNVTSASTLYSDHIEITLTNGAAHPVYVHTLQLRGYPVRVSEPATVTYSDATSIAAYQKRKLRLNACLISEEHVAQRLAEYLVDYYKDPRDVVEGLEILANASDANMALVRDAELLKLYEVTETQTGLSDWTGVCYALRHQITNGLKEHRLVMSLEEPYSYGDLTPVQIDVTEFDDGHVLIY